MRFWDASAVVPLLVRQAATERAQQLCNEDPQVIVWAWTSVECVSALMHLYRDGVLKINELNLARRRLAELSTVWSEVTDLPALRRGAERCLSAHPLRAADAGQLAAALLFADLTGIRIPIVAFDERLAHAARQEGFEVLPEDSRPAS